MEEDDEGVDDAEVGVLAHTEDEEEVVAAGMAVEVVAVVEVAVARPGMPHDLGDLVHGVVVQWREHGGRSPGRAIGVRVGKLEHILVPGTTTGNLAWFVSPGDTFSARCPRAGALATFRRARPPGIARPGGAVGRPRRGPARSSWPTGRSGGAGSPRRGRPHRARGRPR